MASLFVSPHRNLPDLLGVVEPGLLDRGERVGGQHLRPRLTEVRRGLLTGENLLEVQGESVFLEWRQEEIVGPQLLRQILHRNLISRPGTEDDFFELDAT